MMPLAFGLLWTFGAMGWLGLPVDLMNSIFVVFILGIGEDYSVFFVSCRLDEWRGRPSQLNATSAAVLISALTTLFGFAVLVLARHPVLFSLGTTVLLGLVFAILATLVLTLLFTDWVLRPAPDTGAATPAKTIQRRYRYQGKWVEEFVKWKMRLDPVFQRLDEVTPKRGMVLDLGCGYGMGSHWLALSGHEREVLGVDYDADKIRVARQSARGVERVRFEAGNLLEWEFPAADAVLFVDVLHYWTSDKQLLLLKKARTALRPGGRLILRDAARAQSEAHRRVEWWERLVTRLGHNKTVEGLHFQTRAELEAMLQAAGFRDITEQKAAGNDSNILLTASV
jgi:SAM-dependent methyltransferase